MVWEALLRKRDDGRYVYEESQESDAEDLDQWLGDAAGGLVIAPAPDVAALVADRRGGHVYRVTDPSAARGQEVSYLIAWENARRRDRKGSRKAGHADEKGSPARGAG
jgi:hypothetical protein